MKAAEVSPQDTVIEIGPGRGVLTAELAERAGRVIAVEIDEALAAILVGQFQTQPHVNIITADAREVDINSLVPAGAPYKVVANLPYYAASPIIRRFLEAAHKPNLMAVMIQREVARNIAAPPGKMRLVSLAVQIYGKPRIMFYVQPRAFRPAPKVTSALLRIDVYPKPGVSFDSAEHFFTFARAGFSAPRKQLRNCFKHGLSIAAEDAEGMLLQAGVDPTRRAETLSLQEWGNLYDAYKNLVPTGNRSPASAGMAAGC